MSIIDRNTGSGIVFDTDLLYGNARNNDYSNLERRFDRTASASITDEDQAIQNELSSVVVSNYKLKRLFSGAGHY